MSMSRKNAPVLKSTKDYSIFEMHETNRPIHERPELEESMRKFGFLQCFPLACYKKPNEKIKIFSGHHRFVYAQRLKLPIWYIVIETPIDPRWLEFPGILWSHKDHVHSRANEGNQNYISLLEFHRKHHLPIGVASSLLGGEGGGSHNQQRKIRTGEFQARPTKHAAIVTKITDSCIEAGIFNHITAAFAIAVSSAVRIPEFNADEFIRKIRLYPKNITIRGSKEANLQEIEELYNYGVPVKKRIPIALRARQVGSERKKKFGKEEVEKIPE